MKIDYMGNTIVEILNFHGKTDFPFTPGIYVLGDDSATGKTRLYKLLSHLHVMDKRVEAYTYTDIQLLKEKSIDLKRALLTTDEKTQTIMFDRADLYINDITGILDVLKDKYMVLISCKTEMLGDAYYCKVALESPNTISVYV